MSNQLEVIVTSGGTISKIDDVRHIGNFSGGTTGALIAEEFLRSGATVHYVYGKGAKRPFKSSLVVDHLKSIDGEIERIRQAHKEYNEHAFRLHEYGIETFEEYYDTVKGLLTEKSADAIVLAAAVSDYGARTQSGKISSDLDTMQLELIRNPKVISSVKQWDPRVYQVGFKLLTDVSIDELIDVAYKNGIKTHSNLTVANTVLGGDFKQRATVMITPEKGLMPVSLRDLAPRLVEVVNQRVSKQHYRTEVTRDADYVSDMATEIAQFREDVQRLWQLNLFEPYFENSNMQFGFLASRVPQGGFLITSRGSDKRNMPVDDVVYVPEVDFDSRIVYVTSTGKKASLNANVAAKLFDEHSDVNVILHSHVFPGVENKTKVDYSPGTQEDVDEVANHLRGGHRIVELANHGIIALGKGLEDAIAELDIEPAYNNFPEFYDAIYARFQGSTEFVDLVSRVVNQDESILDLAAGTGEVTSQLLERGYKSIAMADRSAGMMDVADEKVGVDIPTFQTTMEQVDVDVDGAYDAIVVRQAINYLMSYDGLVAGFKAMRQTLNDGGRLVFNAPNYHGQSKYGKRDLEYDHEDFHVKVKEMNAVDGHIITHTQHCVLTRHDGSDIKKIYDMNRFGLFTADEFTRALHEAGFEDVKLLGKGLKDYTPDSRTLYCVATSFRTIQGGF